MIVHIPHSELLSFYKLSRFFLSAVTPEEVGSKEICDEIKKRFNTMYRGVVRQMQRDLDQRQLGFRRDLFKIDGGKRLLKSESLQKIALKWNALDLRVDASDFAVDCGDLNVCRAMKRIAFVMELFDKYFLRKFIGKKQNSGVKGDMDYIEILTDCLRDYDGVALLDDFYHVRGHTLDMEKAVKCHCSDAVDEGCIGELMREYRESERTENGDCDKSDNLPTDFEQYVVALEFRERHLLETSTKIHSYLCHESHEEKSVEIGDVKQQKEQIKSKQIGRNAGELKSKFVNEMSAEELSEKIETNRMDDLSHTLWENGLSVDQCCQLMNMLYSQGYDSDAIAADFLDVDGDDPFNLHPQSNLFPMLNGNQFLAKLTKKHVGAKRNDDDALSTFTFGMETIRHWKFWEKQPGYVSTSNYSSLKEECLQNQIYSMSMDQFLRMLFDAFTFSKSSKARKLSAKLRWGDNLIYEVPKQLPLSVTHIFVVLMYCNDTKLQYNYKKFGCRERYKGQTLEELKNWNREIAHWHRLLFEAVKFFGDLVSPKDVFYTGLNIRLCFHTFSPKFHSPFSTTVSIEVAERFSGSSGVILKLKPSLSSLEFYLDVEWLSDFAHEKERLFATAFMGSLMIADIQYFDSGNWWKSGKYMTAFQLFSALFSGHFFFSSFHNKKTGKIRKVLRNLILLHKVTNGFQMPEGDVDALNIHVPLYMQQLLSSLIDGLRKGKESKFLIKSEFALLDEALKRELIVFPESSSDECGLELTPFAQTFCRYEQIVVLTEYLWIIDDAKLKESENCQRFTGNKIDSEIYYFDLPDDGKVSIRLHLGRKNVVSDRTGFSFTIVSTPTPIDGRWSVACYEAGWEWNAVSFYNKESGEKQSRVAFKDSIVDTVETLTIRLALHLSPSDSKK